jgi:hypothetical protein
MLNREEDMHETQFDERFVRYDARWFASRITAADSLRERHIRARDSALHAQCRHENAFSSPACRVARRLFFFAALPSFLPTFFIFFPFSPPSSYSSRLPPPPSSSSSFSFLSLSARRTDAGHNEQPAYVDHDVARCSLSPR